MLHDTVLQKPNGENIYIYHISDDTIHDSVMTFHIIEDIISHHPEIIHSGVLVLRSDNCTGQYKGKYTFHAIKDLAAKYGIYIMWFYGETGHGKGLVDAMSSFGCKNPLKHGIITEDWWYDNASEMVSYLTNDNSKEHYLVDSADLSQKRSTGKQAHIIKPCRCYHVIAVNKEGTSAHKLYFRDDDKHIICR